MPVADPVADPARKGTMHYFKGAFFVTGAGLLLGAVIGYLYTGSIPGALPFLFICTVLAVLEISLSFDNAIVNANKLKTMSPIWQHRFLTWGIVIAVFGMRILFPLLIVSLAAHVGPWQAVKLAATDPHRYGEIMHHAHLGISAFGGTFLMMVALRYFFDEEKEIHWCPWIEERMARSATVRGIEVAIGLAILLAVAKALPQPAETKFLTSAIYGLLTFLLVETLSGFIDARENDARKNAVGMVARGGLGAFLYLEVLDASFSFDGVIGAFALSTNMFVIAIGLGIGAMYVRSMTIMLVEKGTLAEYRYLEHGAFYAILALSVVMFTQSFAEIPEVITGLVGAGLIGLALWSSVRWNHRNCAAD